MISITPRTARSILTRATGYISAYDYTLNPYAGCAFACTYCYAAFFAPTRTQQHTWGRWIEVKENALDLLRKRRKRPLDGQTIYMSSVTDPYQPVEKRLQLTRALLAELAAYHRVQLVVQTRSPLVTRDLDLLQKFPRVRVHMTVTTDDEEVRRTFEPACPPNSHRLAAITQVADAGISTAITMTPLLPVRDPLAFAQTLRATGAERFVVDYFQATHGRFVAGTGARACELAQSRGWTPARYAEVTDVFRQVLPNLYEGRDGFAPDPQPGTV
jgi:DNA repair photolyase